jgi:hypothetical protein
MITRQRLQLLFRLPKSDADVGYERLHREALAFAETIHELTPQGIDQETAIRRVREALMFSYAAISCNDDT